MSSYSFGIYLIHARIVNVVAVILDQLGITVNNILFYLSTFMVTLIVSLAVVVILKQLPHHEYIIGKTGSGKSSFDGKKLDKSGTSPQK